MSTIESTKSDLSLLPCLSIPAAGVGCVDLMTKDEGDNLGFFVRIYYPAKAFTADASSNATSMSWFPPEDEYVRGWNE